MALDLIEEFRQVIVDRLVISLINKKMVDKDSFENINNQVLFVDKGRKMFLEAYENKILDKIKHPVSDEPISWRKVIEEQAKILKNSIINNYNYIPFEVR